MAESDGSNDVPALRELVCFNFYRGWRGISEYYKKYLPPGVSAQQSYILEVCAAPDGALVNQIATALEIEISAISGMLRRMEKSGLITRTVNAENRRETVVRLTNEGVAQLEHIRHCMIEADASLRELIPQPLVDELIDIVDRVRMLR